MSILTRKLVRDLLHARGQLTAIISIIAVGVMCFVGMVGTYRNLRISKQSFYTQCRMAHFWVNLRKAPNSEVISLLDIDGIKRIRTRINFPVTVDIQDVAKPLSGRVISMPKRRQAVLNDIHLKRGSYFTGKRENEVILSDEFALKRKLRPGDTIHLLLNNQRKELIIVGTADSSEFTYLMSPGSLVPSPENFGIFYLQRRFAEEVFNFEGACNEVVGQFNPKHQENPGVLLKSIEQKLDSFGVLTTTPLKDQDSNFMITNEISQGEVMATVLASIFLIVAALVLNVLMTRLAEQQRTVVGTLKAFGYTNGEIFLHFMQFGLCVGFLGGFLGCLAGFFLAGSMTYMYSTYYSFPQLNNNFYLSIFLLGMSLSIGFAVLGTLRGIWSVQQLRPAEAMRPKPPVSGKRIVLEQWTWFWKSLRFETQMVLRGLFRHRVRTLAGIFAAMMGSAIMLNALYFHDAIYYLIDFQYGTVDRSDYTLVFKEPRNFGALAEGQALSGVNHAEPIFSVACTLTNGPYSKKTAISGLVKNSLLMIPRDSDGNRVQLPETGLLVNHKLAEILHIKPGDYLTLVPVRGLRRPIRIQVVRVVQSYLGLVAYADFSFLNKTMSEENAISTIQIKMDDDLITRQKLFREVKKLPSLETLSSARETRLNLEEQILGPITVMVWVLIGFAGIIFMGSILNASLVSLAERKREIATFRVLGYTTKEIGRIFWRENLLTNLVGTALGLPLGYLLALFTSSATESELFRFPFYIEPFSYFLTVILALIICAIAHRVVQHLIDRMNWQEALNVKE